MVTTHLARFPELRLQNGFLLKDFCIAYETHGKLNQRKDNAILIFHALSGGSHVAGTLERNDEGIDPKTYLEKHGCFPEPTKGWWDIAVGPGKAFDPDKHFLICANMIGGCYGSTGPCSTNPSTGKPYGSKFPVITVRDIVQSQKLLLDHLGIKHLFAVVGGSFGGMCVLEWSVAFPKSADLYVPIATSASRLKLNVSRNNNQKYAITTDIFFGEGDYYDKPWPGRWPVQGLKLARMLAHETYIDIDAKEVREEVIPNDATIDPYKIQNPIESFMHREGNRFVLRFDANTYIKIIDAWNSFDMMKYGNGSLSSVFKDVKGEFLVVGISDDFCFFESQSRELVNALIEDGLLACYRIIDSTKGHDAFLVEAEQLNDYISPVLERVYRKLHTKE